MDEAKIILQEIHIANKGMHLHILKEKLKELNRIEKARLRVNEEKKIFVVKIEQFMANDLKD